MAYFNPTRPSYLEDPYPSLARLRHDDPVFWSSEIQMWVVTTYAGCETVLQDAATYSTDAGHATGWAAEHARETTSSTALGEAPRMIGSDDPDHERLRRVVNRAFTPRAVERSRAGLADLASRLLNDVTPAGFDFAEVIARPFARDSVMEHLRVPPAEREPLREWSRAVVLPARTAGSRSAAHEAYASLLAYLNALPPADESGPVLAMITAAAREERLSEGEMVGLAADLVIAGQDATVGLLTNGFNALSRYREQYSRLREEPGLAGRAVEELLRYDAPVQALIRFARQDGTLGRRRIAAGDGLMLMVGAGNRDPARFTDPDRLDLGRDEGRPLSFSLGMHTCVGAPLARLAAGSLLEAFASRFRALHPAPRSHPRRQPDWMQRAFTSLQLTVEVM